MLNFDACNDLEGLQNQLRLLENQFAKRVGKAAYLLALVYSPDNTFVPDECKIAISASKVKSDDYYRAGFGLLLEEAESRNGESMYLLAQYFQAGLPPVRNDLLSAVGWNEKSLKTGFLPAASELYAVYSNSESELHDPVRAQWLLQFKNG